MFLRLCLTIPLLSVVSGVYGASVAVDVVNPLAAIDNITLSDNSTKALNVSDSSALKIRDVDVQLRELVPMCQCTCTNVTDIAGAIKNAASLDISTDKAQDGSDSRFLKVRDVGALQPNSQGFNLSVKLTVGNSTNLNNSTDKAGNGSSNFTVRASLPPSVVARDVDVQLKSLEANVSDDMSAVNSTVNSTSDLSMGNASAMEERGIEDIVPFDDALFGDVANISEIASVIFDFDTKTNVSQPSNISSLIVERESDVDMADLEDSNMDLEGLLSLRDNNSTEKVSNSSSEVEKSEVKSGRGVVVVVT
ncbi:hypothetical protein DAPPUDRAFT_230022 [Daphnia pulex]|uniref:Uncharacterized protein n=1 Tax=Daphnia pulex TaxID=6669 RepID=E9I2H0_DAPPU|nr:hypothetical protein DAPPUDRAFT_230022 [Daphnia pulex]|eukprot:EFX61810.1 hypothetical protein DAPPUDRAFT_230022 [Daphnia pulex]